MRTKNLPLPDIDTLRSEFIICENSKSGLRYSFNDRREAGYLVCGKRDSYYYIYFNKKRYAIHRLIYFIHTGIDPLDNFVDHIDGNSLNNKINNLRLCKNNQNIRNSKRYSTNTTGYKGVSKYGKKFAAVIYKDYKQHWLGVFDDPEEAYRAYCLASKKYHGEFGRTA